MKIVVFLSIISLSVIADDISKEIWSKGNEHYYFSLEAKSRALFSEHCYNESVSLEKSPCQAVQILSKAKTLTPPKQANIGGKNPGAIVCKDLLGKKIEILKNHNNNENAFCVFDDGSMITAISLQTLLKD